jgi:hypothetical protein
MVIDTSPSARLGLEPPKPLQALIHKPVLRNNTMHRDMTLAVFNHFVFGQAGMRRQISPKRFFELVSVEHVHLDFCG